MREVRPTHTQPGDPFLAVVGWAWVSLFRAWDGLGRVWATFKDVLR